MATGSFVSFAQELYPYTESASNMPTGTLSAKLATSYGRHFSERLQKYVPEVMFGISKKTMVHVAVSFFKYAYEECRMGWNIYLCETSFFIKR